MTSARGEMNGPKGRQCADDVVKNPVNLERAAFWFVGTCSISPLINSTDYQIKIGPIPSMMEKKGQ